MATIKTDMELYLGYMKKDELVDEYLQLFQSWVDMILVHVGVLGLYNDLHSEIFASQMDTTMQAQISAKSQEA